MALIPCEILRLEVFDNGEESITGNERERERERERDKRISEKFVIQAQVQYITQSSYFLFIELENTYKTKSSRSSILIEL